MAILPRHDLSHTIHTPITIVPHGRESGEGPTNCVLVLMGRFLDPKNEATAMKGYSWNQSGL